MGAALKLKGFDTFSGLFPGQAVALVPSRAGYPKWTPDLSKTTSLLPEYCLCFQKVRLSSTPIFFCWVALQLVLWLSLRTVWKFGMRLFERRERERVKRLRRSNRMAGWMILWRGWMICWKILRRGWIRMGMLVRNLFLGGGFFLLGLLLRMGLWRFKMFLGLALSTVLSSLEVQCDVDGGFLRS